MTLELTSTSTVQVQEIQYSSTASTSTEYEYPALHATQPIRRHVTYTTDHLIATGPGLFNSPSQDELFVFSIFPGN